MAELDLPIGNDPAEKTAPRHTTSATLYANKAKITKYPNPTRYYGPWSTGKTYACSNDAPYSSIEDTGGLTISDESCPNGNTLMKIVIP